MAAKAPRQRKPRIRKAPTVRQRIESSAISREQPARRRLKISPLRFVFKFLKKAISPLAPLFRPVKRFLAWLTPSYFISAWAELQQVTWPNRRETWRLTGAVFVFAVVFGALVAVVDKGLDALFQRVILR